jgi:uncharacterized protein DUF3703
MRRSKPMPAAVREALDHELDAARAATDPTDRWTALERAHILSQPWAWPHTVTHWRMLTVAIRQRDRREALGQVVRLAVAAPGSLSGRYPTGNTGRVDAGLTTPMPLPDDLAAILAEPRPR